MQMPGELAAILKQNLAPADYQRARSIFEAIVEPENVTKARRELLATSFRLEAVARTIRRDEAWLLSLLPPADREESYAALCDRALRQLRHAYSYLSMEEFCDRFHIARTTAYRKLHPVEQIAPAGPILKRLKMVQRELGLDSKLVRLA